MAPWKTCFDHTLRACVFLITDWTNDETDQSLDVEAAESPGPVKCEENPSTQLGGAGEMVHISEDQTQLSTVTGYADFCRISMVL